MFFFYLSFYVSVYLHQFLFFTLLMCVCVCVCVCSRVRVCQLANYSNFFVFLTDCHSICVCLFLQMSVCPSVYFLSVSQVFCMLYACLRLALFFVYVCQPRVNKFK